MVAGGATSDAEHKASGDGGIQALLREILQGLEVPDRRAQAKQEFMLSIDHCFQVKGKGTVITGTVLQGKVKVGDSVEIPAIREQKKVKSIQMFRKPVQEAHGGDRIGMNIAQLDSSKLERGLATSPGFVAQVTRVLAKVQKIGYFTEEVKSKQKFHLTIGHQTVMAQIRVFSEPSPDGIQGKLERLSLGEGNAFRFNHSQKSETQVFDRSKVYRLEEKLLSQKQLDQIHNPKKEEESKHQPEQQLAVRAYYAILELERPVLSPPNALLIASKLDKDVATKSCRLAFSGKILEFLDDEE